MMYDSIRKLFGLTETRGFSEVELAKARQLFGRIPLALELYYRELGRDETLNRMFNYLMIPWENHCPLEQGYLYIFTENQGVCNWAISLMDLDLEDPPVYATYDDIFDKGIDTWALESEKLSDFFIAMAHFHAVYALPFASEGYYIEKDKADSIRNHYKKKCEPTRVWVDGGMEFYGNHAYDSIVLMRAADGDDYYYDLNYASGDQSSFEEMERVMSSLGVAY